MVKLKYKIDKDVPIPKKHVHWSKFPFESMDIGDSFLTNIKTEEKTSCNQLKTYLYYKAKKYCIETFSNAKFSFCVNRTNKTVRVFRVE